ncbi:MAG: GGDEF domain-containing protein [Labilithrix sp.]|nr:GGDEF domain-containing protein [Labilithrix sp.]MBX3220555.1 GGDEF domain-containing protein [Labilithrix sp.]
MTTSAPPSSSGHAESDAAWQLIREDIFDRQCDDEELERLLSERELTSEEPHTELIRLMLGMSLCQAEARALYTRVVAHRKAMAESLGRPVHVRVAALDLLTSRPATRKNPRESVPIMVAPAMLERALEEAGADAVTGLPRAGNFLNLLQHELRQRRRRVTVVYVDLDGFKLVNDAHGHARGDEVLRTMAAAARSVLRRGDVVARLGGDEFALMLVDASLEESRAAIKRLRARFEELTAPLATSFSAGIAIADDTSTADELIASADRAMYEEKRRRAAR